MSERAAVRTVADPTPAVSFATGSSLLQRSCVCGGAAGLSGACEGCSKKKRLALQAKLKINEPGDRYEQEADRVADHVMATPARGDIGRVAPRIQRVSADVGVGCETAPASVYETLAGAGRPLDPVLRRGMEHRFGHDFSRVRVHTDAVADRSARDVSADAYTVGHNVVFGRGLFSPATQEGRRLIAHELTHVVQQTGTEPVLARRPVRAPARQQFRVQVRPYWEQQGHYGPTVRTPQRRSLPPYPRVPKGGALTAQAIKDFHTPYPKIAIATFAPLGKLTLRHVSWGGRFAGFDKEGTATIDSGDPERLRFAILEPPTSIPQEGYRDASVDVSNEYTWDKYVVPVISDLSAALVVPLDAETERVFSRFGREIESTMKWGFLGDFVGTYWVPIESVQILETIPGGGVVLSPAGVVAKAQREGEKAQQEWWEQVARSPKPDAFSRMQELRDKESAAKPEALRFAFDRREVTPSNLSAWIDREHPDGISNRNLLAALGGSSEFSFSGSADARREAAIALVVALEQEPQTGEGTAVTNTAPTRRRRRRRKRKCKRAGGTSCPTWRPRLTSRNEYWDQAFNFRRAQRLLMPSHFRQNVAVLVLDGEPPIIRTNEMQFHSEQQILWTLVNRDLTSDCPIIALFSERKPCQEICQRQILPQLCRINGGVPFDVYFATDYYNSAAGIRSDNNRHALVTSYAQAGYFDGF